MFAPLNTLRRVSLVPLGLCAVALALGAPALATGKGDAEKAAALGSPKLFRDLVDCRAIAADAERLACYDRQVAALARAEEAKDIVVADRAEVREARKGLFGFSVNLGRIFDFGGKGKGGSDDAAEAEEIKRIDTTVTAVGRIRDGGLRLVFAEGGTWEQIDTRGFALAPRAGQKATITRGSFGSYYVSVDGQPGIKMRRVQ